MSRVKTIHNNRKELTCGHCYETILFVRPSYRLHLAYMTIKPIGARVHHCGSKWSLNFDEETRRKYPSHGWGTVTAVLCHNADGTFEYEVEKDASVLPRGVKKGYWASYHIDRWEIL